MNGPKRPSRSTISALRSSLAISSTDVNEYLREAAGEAFTAKDFRTWAGTVLAATALAEFEAFDSKAQAKRNVVAAIERDDRLGEQLPPDVLQRAADDLTHLGRGEHRFAQHAPSFR